MSNASEKRIKAFVDSFIRSEFMLVPVVHGYTTAARIAPENVSRVEVLATKSVVNDYGREIAWKLEHATAGFRAAGSMARYSDETWSVVHYIAGTRHGNTYRNYGAAMARWESL